MGDQCVNIAKLVPLSGNEPPKDKEILDTVEQMGDSPRAQVVEAKEAFETRNVPMAEALVRQDAKINRLNREVFRRAVEVGDDPEVREWAMFMILVARCLERIGDNTALHRRTDGIRCHRPVSGGHRPVTLDGGATT